MIFSDNYSRDSYFQHNKMPFFKHDEFMAKFNKAIADKREGEMVFTQMFLCPDKRHYGHFAYLSKRQVLGELQSWRQRGWYSRACNVKKLKTESGQDCWMFVIQSDNEELMEELTGLPIGLFFGGMLVSGLPYLCFEEGFIDVVQRVIGRND